MTNRDSPYRCEYCGLGVHPDDKGIAKYRAGWLKNGSGTIKFPGPVLMYAHWVCVETKTGRLDDSPMLF